MEHVDLVMRAEKWLEQQNCGVVIREPFRSSNREQPDAIGWRTSISILIECKSSRADFLKDKYKSFRAFPERGLGDWRFYLSPPEIINVSDLPDGWGLLWATSKNTKRVHGVPPNTRWGKPPFIGVKEKEQVMLVSALRRLKLRGHLNEIYEGIPDSRSG